MNFLLRTPLWPVQVRGSRPVGSFRASEVPVLDLQELAAGKLAALFARAASRDVFDAVELLRCGELDLARLRLAFIVYGGANRRDWRTISKEEVRLDGETFERELLPTLRIPPGGKRSDTAERARGLVDECRERLSVVLPLRKEEHEFLTLLNDRGEIAPDLLTTDDSMKATIRQHPALLWKALNAQGRIGPDDRRGARQDPGA